MDGHFLELFCDSVSVVFPHIHVCFLALTKISLPTSYISVAYFISDCWGRGDRGFLLFNITHTLMAFFFFSSFSTLFLFFPPSSPISPLFLFSSCFCLGYHFLHTERFSKGFSSKCHLVVMNSIRIPVFENVGFFPL